MVFLHPCGLLGSAFNGCADWSTNVTFKQEIANPLSSGFEGSCLKGKRMAHLLCSEDCGDVLIDHWLELLSMYPKDIYSEHKGWGHMKDENKICGSAVTRNVFVSTTENRNVSLLESQFTRVPGIRKRGDMTAQKKNGLSTFQQTIF